jgi:hypothetical protein
MVDQLVIDRPAPVLPVALYDYITYEFTGALGVDEVGF